MLVLFAVRLLCLKPQNRQIKDNNEIHIFFVLMYIVRLFLVHVQPVEIKFLGFVLHKVLGFEKLVYYGVYLL